MSGPTASLVPADWAGRHAGCVWGATGVFLVLAVFLAVIGVRPDDAPTSPGLVLTGGGPVQSGSVSYTHLDVYKRQARQIS